MTNGRVHEALNIGLETGNSLSGLKGKGTCHLTWPEGLAPAPGIEGHAYTNAFDFDYLLTGKM